MFRFPFCLAPILQYKLLSINRVIFRDGSVFLCLTNAIVTCMGNETANKQKGKQMRSNNKMILRAKLMKQYTEEWVLDCTGMSVDAIKEEMQQAYVDDRESVGWDCVSVDLDHSEITTNLEIVEWTD